MSEYAQQKTHNATLVYLTKPAYQNSILLPINNNTNKNILTKEDKKFYKKRVLAATKELFYKNDYPKSINKMHDGYILQMIEYFKTCDTEDILQSEYKNMDIDDNNQDDIIIENESLDDANKHLYNIPSKTITLNNYVTTTKLKVEKQYVPKQKKVNLKSPELKIKGLKTKRTKSKNANLKEI